MMTINKVILPIIVFISTLIISYYGFKEVSFATTFLQLLFSTNILGSLIKHFLLMFYLDKIQESVFELFKIDDLKTNTNKYQAVIIRYWMQYESLLSKMPIRIPNQLFEKHNPELTTEWKNIKTKYNIN